MDEKNRVFQAIVWKPGSGSTGERPAGGSRLMERNADSTLAGSGASCTATGAGARQLALTWDASGRLSKTVAGTTTHYACGGDDLYARFTSGWSAPTSVTVHGGGGVD